MNTDMVVIWNGAHRGQDLDLLCVQMPVVRCETVVARAFNQPAQDREGHDRRFDAVVQVLADQQWHTVVDLVERTDSTAAEIYVTIQRLRRAKRLQRGYIPKRLRTRGQGWMAYRLRVQAGSPEAAS